MSEYTNKPLTTTLDAVKLPIIHDAVCDIANFRVLFAPADQYNLSHEIGQLLLIFSRVSQNIENNERLNRFDC